MLLRRLARPLLASTFIVDGAETLRNPESRVKEASALVHKGEESLPPDIATKLPSDPGALVQVTAVTQIVGGALLALGKAPRLAALALAATVVPATVTEQNFWAENDPQRRAAKRTAFLKDMSLLGGLMIVAADTEGKPSLGWRGRRAAKAAAATVSGALPLGESAKNGTAGTLRHQLHQAAERGRELAGTAAEKSTELAEVAQQRAPIWAETVKHRGVEIADITRHRGAELAEIAKQRGEELAEVAQQRGPEWADRAKYRGAEIADIAKHRGAVLAEVAQQRGPEWADRAKHRGAEIADIAKHRGEELAETARHRGAGIVGVAQEQGPELVSRAKHRTAELADRARYRGVGIADTAKAQGNAAPRKRARGVLWFG
ncbi:DoxX family protein [Nocardia paucivorans]|uniref:DoxX family protein n=1 Tax=Nocardia paucivorans TaxID=114259 RepID=UPI0002EB2014|nr:DoxX family protein [Nocardia paucivorans]